MNPTSKILKYKTYDKYIIFYKKTCIYCENALELLKRKNLNYRSYNVEKIGGIQTVLENLKANKSQLNFDVSHKTVPIIFKHGKFIGGFTELNKLLKE
jgi:glutaredoxin